MKESREDKILAHEIKIEIAKGQLGMAKEKRRNKGLNLRSTAEIRLEGKLQYLRSVIF